jgi:hypothetical protein
MRNLTATICLTIAVLGGYVERIKREVLTNLSKITLVKNSWSIIAKKSYERTAKTGVEI